MERDEVHYILITFQGRRHGSPARVRRHQDRAGGQGVHAAEGGGHRRQAGQGVMYCGRSIGRQRLPTRVCDLRRRHTLSMVYKRCLIRED